MQNVFSLLTDIICPIFRLLQYYYRNVELDGNRSGVFCFARINHLGGETIMEFTRQLQAETSEQIAIHLGRQQMVIFARGIKDLDQQSTSMSCFQMSHVGDFKIF